MNKADLNECVSIINDIIRLVLATVPSSSGSNTANLARDTGALLANTADQINAGTGAGALAQCFADATSAGADLPRMSSARAQIEALVTVSPAAALLVDTAVVYALSQEGVIIGNTVYTARDTVEQVLAQMSIEFDDAIEGAADRNDSDVYQAVIALAGAVTQYLVKVQQPLPFLTTYSYGAPMPSLVLAQRLYADASRADELLNQNHVIHPAFMPRSGVCLSA